MINIKNLLRRRSFWWFFLTAIILISVITPILVIFVIKGKPIEISSDDDFARYDLPGSGTKIDPYRIENRKMNIFDYYAIAIINISKYVIIQNNHIKSIGCGIFISVNISGLIEIKNNVLKDCLAPINIIETQGCIIRNNIIRNGIYGIYAFNVDYKNEPLNFIIQNNTFINIANSEIALFGAGGSIIENNSCEYDASAISEDYHPSKWTVGFSILFLNGTTIRNNVLSHKGIQLYDSYPENYHKAIFENNYVRGKKVGFFVNATNLTFNENIFSQLFLINCSNILVDGQTSLFSGLGVSLVNCSNCNIIDCTFRNNGYAGIHIFESSFIQINNNYFDFNFIGLKALNSFNLTISNNSFIDGEYGIEFDNCTYVSIDNSFAGNEVDVSER